MYNNLIGSPHSSISNDDVDSDPGDPIHNDSILNELFYKQMVSVINVRRNKIISLFRVTVMKILGRVGTHIF